MFQLASILLLSAWALLLPVPPIAAAQPDSSLPGVVNRPISGDTLDVSIDGVRTPVALLGAAAAPLNSPCGAEAAARLAELAPAGATLTLVADAAYPGVDPDRRAVLYYAYLSDGT